MRDQADKIELLIKQFNWHSPSWDLFIFLFWAVASVLYAFAAGRGRVLSILISIYISKLLVLEAPFLTQELAKHLKGPLIGYGNLLAFAALFMLLFLFLSRYAFKTTVDRKHVSGFIFTLIFAFFQIGLLINIVLTLLPLEAQGRLSQLVSYLFIGQIANFVWLTLPIVYLVILGRHISDHGEL